MRDAADPFHAGELRAQALAGKTDVPEWAAGFIRPFMPDQHRDFFSQLPFLVLAGADDAGRHWVTLLDGPDGFVRSPDDTTLAIASTFDAQDPLAAALGAGTDVGVLGIELATRRRNRMSGRLRRSGAGFVIDVRQSFGNCPQYIHEREWRRVPTHDAPDALRSTALTADQTARIRAADTLFIGTGQMSRDDHASNGFDASHRGGAPGFVSVVDATHLRIPDYAGNNFFNTIGNLLENPAIGLAFVDFETGGLLQLSGTAKIDWDATDSHDPGALRMIDVTIDAVVDRPAALSLRWSADTSDLQDLVVAKKVDEAQDITSFHLVAADGGALEPFEAGQHLPIELEIPGQPGRTRRSYSLSGAPDSGTYRLSIKREGQGLASRYLHDSVQVGDRIRARRASGEFVVPCSNCPLVLVSAGVGLTPMVSMLHAAVSERADRSVWYVHGARSGAHHALKSEVDALVARRPNLVAHTLYSRPEETDRPGIDFHETGRVTAKTLLNLTPGDDAHYMLCGPAKFIADIRDGLEAAGVPAQHIHFETFGPTG
ncbi:FAD-binding oxidoreductase [Roseobacter sinensis]|uniref:Pyridoxamine 5'-phosphate oxidase family protein n=1 Tax=Roseobacter sinensis TaxID=2931391 RepID=A0ABT3BEP2_9RHOB|nr:pyridoxamine 5'-phosphate oxidase family protein [Roseobacter sp. WL0113]MCV3271839.1 pyridoxamine 5'-phosphate oxidase family protein [Roseobacter sp. WL0113]